LVECSRPSVGSCINQMSGDIDNQQIVAITVTDLD
jgi:hypothetical protein